MTWWMSTVAWSITGRHHQMWKKPQVAECASRCSGGRCGRTVTQLQCVNDCYLLAKTRWEKLVKVAVSDCDEWSGSTIPEPLPISTVPSMLQCRKQSRLTRFGTDIDNMEMVADDGGGIPAQFQDSHYQDLSYPCEIEALGGRMQQKIWEHLHGTYHGMQREFVRKRGSGLRSVWREWEEMTR